MAAKKTPTVERPALLESHRVFCEAVAKGPEEFWDNLVALEIQRCRTTWDGLTPVRLANLKDDLANYCGAVRAYREADRASE